MSNPDTLVYNKGFKENPQNINRAGMKKGTKHRKTIIEELLALPTDGYTNEEYKMIWALLKRAQKGNVAAIQEIQNTMYGVIPNKTLTAETTPEDLEEDITDEIMKAVPQEALDKILGKPSE